MNYVELKLHFKVGQAIISLLNFVWAALHSASNKWNICKKHIKLGQWIFFTWCNQSVYQQPIFCFMSWLKIATKWNKYNQPAFMFDITQLVKPLLLAQYNYFLLTQNTIYLMMYLWRMNWKYVSMFGLPANDDDECPWLVAGAGCC